jgi:hypothetical protein
LKAGIDQKVAEERRREEEQRRKVEAAQAVRRTLISDLQAFGEAVGHFSVDKAAQDGLRLSYREHELTFTPEGELSDVSVSGSGLSKAAVIQLEPTLQKWVLRWTRRGSRESVLLFDQGLEVLLRTVFGIAPLAEQAAPAESSESAAGADSGRGSRTL